MSSDSAPSPPRQAIENQTARILASPVFSKSERMSRFLQFIVQRALDGRSEDLKEYSIALEVFDKEESFDPRIDPTVRSEARRLRSKLAEYYETAQDDDKIQIDLPKGAYAPVFRNRSPAGSGPRRVSRAQYRYAAIALAALTAVTAGTWWWLSRRSVAHNGPRSIAVLPFENLSADPANEYFSDGLTEEILNALANTPGIKVAARTSAFQFKGKHEDIRSIGKKLNVDTLLEGSVRKEGDRLRITPQLINVSDGYHLWSSSYDREWKNLFEVQREIATAIAGALGAKLGHVPPRPVDAETYRLYLEGRHQFARWNPSGMLKAIALFEQVIARDPNYTPAYVGLSSAYGLLTAFGSDAIPPAQSRTKAKNAALKAIELDPNSSEAWLSLAPKLVEELDWPGAEGAFRKALDLGPNSSDAHAWFAEMYLTPMRRLDEALKEARAAWELDPISPYACVMVARRYYFHHQFDSAIAWGQKALDLDPHFDLARPLLVHSYLCKGDTKGARQFLKNAGQVWREQILSLHWAQTHAAEGNGAEARKILGGLNVGPGSACQMAGTYVWLNEPGRATNWLDRAVDARATCFVSIPVDPLFDRLHSNPDFLALLRKMQVPANY